MSKIALITGITGQDGSYLAELLLKKKYIVHGLIRKKTFKNNKNFWRIKNILKKLKLHEIDTDNFYKLDKIVKKVKPHEVYHLAAQAYDGHSFENEFYTLNINLNFTHKILSAVKKANPKASFFFAGSSEMYDKNIKQKINEKTNFNPKSAYGIAKVASYYLIKNYRENLNFKASTGILFNHESPRRGVNFVTKKIVQGLVRIKQGKQKTLTLGNLYSKRDWGHAIDYVESMWKILQQKKADDFVVATKTSYSVKDFVNTCAKKLQIKLVWKNSNLKEIGINQQNNKIIINIDKKYFRETEVDNLIGNFAKAKKILRWQPKFSFEKLVEDMIEKELYE